MNFFKDIASYPFRGKGRYIFITGVIFSLISDLASLAPLIGGIASLFLFGYFCATYFQMIESSATGGKEAPEFPELSNIMDDIIVPVLKVLLALLVSFGPVLAYTISSGNGANPWVSFPLLAFGILYAPMAILSIVILGSIGAISPMIVLPAIVRAGWLYMAAVGILLTIYGGEMIISSALGNLFIAKHLILAAIGMYCLMANGRALGLIFRDRREELNWI
jgi:hypothetical protein